MPVLLAQTVLLAAKIGDQILREGAQLLQFKKEIPVFIAVLLLLVYAPLSFFAVQLERAKRAGSRDYGVVACDYVNRFRDKWLRRDEPGRDSILGTSDIQSLADLTNSFDVVGEVRMVPITQALLLRLALPLALALPFAPLLLTMFPLDEIIERLIKLGI